MFADVDISIYNIFSESTFLSWVQERHMEIINHSMHILNYSNSSCPQLFKQMDGNETRSEKVHFKGKVN